MTAMLEPLLVASILGALACLAATAIAGVTSALRHGGRREESGDDPRTQSVSRFTVPVSLLVPINGHSDAAGISATIAGLLDLDYPELEVIVLAETLPAAVWDALKLGWTLEAREFFFRQTLPAAGVNKIYRSAREPRLMVVDKTPAGRASTLNCGINLARFRYVAAIDLGIHFDEDSLMRAMSAPLRDPAAVVATSSHLEVRTKDDEAPTLQGALQHLESIRAVMQSRLTSKTRDAGLELSESVVVWRREAVVQLGGFSEQVTSPDEDMLVRLQSSATPAAAGQVVRTAEIFGRVNPRSVREHAQQVADRQRSALHVLWAERHGFMAGKRALMHLAAAEILMPLLETWVVAATVAGALIGWFAWRDAVLAIALLSFGNATVTAAALLVRGAGAGTPPEPTLRRLLLAAPLELLVSGAGSFVARSSGAWAFVGDLQKGTGQGR